MACHVVPSDAISIVIVECGQTRLVMKFLQALNCHSYVKFCLNGSLLQTLKIIGLGHSVSEAQDKMNEKYADIMVSRGT